MTDFTAGPDGETLYFQSSRPTFANDERDDTNIWAVHWLGSDWSKPFLPENFTQYRSTFRVLPLVAIAPDFVQAKELLERLNGEVNSAH